jgi:catechol-2,3-dioxygenase
MEQPFARSAEDLGNVVALEHVNVEIPDQQLATEFYMSGLGLTRDPYLMTGTANMWVNIGRSQFHLPSGDALVVRGHVGIVLPDLEALLRRLSSVKKALADTRFGWRETNDYVEATCPWGNKIRLYAPDEERFGAINLGVPYVEFDVPVGTADGIARFYREILGTTAKVEGNGGGKCAKVVVGQAQHLLFRETDRPLPDYDGHHIQVYVADFSGPHQKLLERRLVTEESDQYQYRFEDLVDLDSGKVLFQIEHEIRSVTHPLYGRTLVNRNPAQSNRNYEPGHDAWTWSLRRDCDVNRPSGPRPNTSTLGRRRAARMAAQQA